MIKHDLPIAVHQRHGWIRGHRIALQDVRARFHRRYREITAELATELVQHRRVIFAGDAPTGDELNQHCLSAQLMQREFFAIHRFGGEILRDFSGQVGGGLHRPSELANLSRQLAA